jgi:hypothetical protein
LRFLITSDDIIDNKMIFCIVGTRESKLNLNPVVLPYVDKTILEHYDPEQGVCTNNTDKNIIKVLMEELKPYLKEGYSGDVTLLFVHLPGSSLTGLKILSFILSYRDALWEI